MKWKGRRQSKNVVDDTDKVTIIPEGTQLMDGSRYSSSQDRPDIKAARELRRLGTRGEIPVPTSKPKQIQVTPGKWKSK